MVIYIAERCAAEEFCRVYDRRAKLAGWRESLLVSICPACLDAGQAEINALTYDYIDLEQQLPVRPPSQEFVSGTKERPTPINLAAESYQRAIWLLVTTWSAILGERLSLSDVTGTVRDGWAVQRAVAVLSSRVGYLSTVPVVAAMSMGEMSGVDAILRMTALHHRIRSFLGLTSLTHHLPGECPRCDYEALCRDDGSETVYCAQCQMRGTWDDYRAMMRAEVITP